MLTLLFLGLASLAPAHEQVVATSSANAPQCRAAAEIIRDVVLPSARKVATRDFVFRQNVRIGSGELLRNRYWHDSPGPPSDLLSRLEAQGDVDAVASCSEVRLLLGQERVRFDKRSVERGSRLKRNIESTAIIYGASLPVLSEDGTQALFMRTMYCGGRCASGELVHAQRSAGGHWVVVTNYGIWVS